MFTRTEFLRSKKGFLIVEAAIALPIFIIAILTVASLMRMASLEERAAFACASELSEVAAKAASYPVRPEVPLLIKSEVSSEIPGIEGVAAKKYKYRAKSAGGGAGEQIELELTFNMNTGLPGRASSGLSATEFFVLRAFCGKDNSKSAFDSDDSPETDLEAETVYLFPDYGEKYHGESCTYINSYPFQTVMTKDTARKYKACSTCRPGKSSYGKIVYCFKYGSAYHASDCNTIDKYVISMDRRDAEKRGYERCSKCGGV